MRTVDLLIIFKCLQFIFLLTLLFLSFPGIDDEDLCKFATLILLKRLVTGQPDHSHIGHKEAVAKTERRGHGLSNYCLQISGVRACVDGAASVASPSS